MSNKELYSQFCSSKLDIPVFFQPWWLDIVTFGGSWEVLMDTSADGQVRGVLPLFQKSKLGIKFGSMPPLTPYLGIYVNYPENIEKEERKRAFEEKVVNNLTDQLGNQNYFNQNFHRGFKSWLPLHWKGFRNTTKLTNVFEDLSDLSKIKSGFKDSLRNKLNKAEGILTIEETDDIGLFHGINKKTFERQGMSIPYSLDFLRKLNDGLALRNQRKIFLAKDGDGQYHSGAFIVIDDKYHYLIALGADTSLRKSGAIPFVIWHAIQDTAMNNKAFDFEGSTIPAVAGIFRNFGAQQEPYYNIYKSRNKVTDALLTLVGKF